MLHIAGFPFLFPEFCVFFRGAVSDGAEDLAVFCLFFDHEQSGVCLEPLEILRTNEVITVNSRWTALSRLFETRDSRTTRFAPRSSAIRWPNEIFAVYIISSQYGHNPCMPPRNRMLTRYCRGIWFCHVSTCSLNVFTWTQSNMLSGVCRCDVDKSLHGKSSFEGGCRDTGAEQLGIGLNQTK